jgi:alpha-galactosidase
MSLLPRLTLGLLLCAPMAIPLSAQEPSPAPENEILTPPPGDAPRINGARVFGVRPGSPFLFQVAATGKKPRAYAAEGLPEGVAIDHATGAISGVAPARGAYRATLIVTNEAGAARRPFRIEVGDTLALTPPMGWNSWYCWSESVDAAKIRATARAMADQGLIDHGWTYVNVDDCWQGLRGGPFQAIQGNANFPDLAALAAEVHGLGLKFGLYSTCWMGSYAGHIGGTAPNAEGDYTALMISPDQQLGPGQVFGRHPNAIKRGVAVVGPHWFIDRDARQYAAWGVDYVKYDWQNWTLTGPEAKQVKPKDEATLARLEHDLRAVPRDIVLSLSPLSLPEGAAALAAHANLWRTTKDITDEWKGIRRLFDAEDWNSWTGPGHYCDPDMLQLGRMGKTNRQNTVLQPSRLTPDEQYTQVTFWSLLSAPLLLSCDIGALDPFTLNLITNDEVIDIDQDSLCRAAKRVAGAGTDLQVWAKDLEDGSLAVGLFNLSDQPATIAATWSALGLAGPRTVRDVWRQNDLGTFNDSFSSEIHPHGMRLLKLTRIVSAP